MFMSRFTIDVVSVLYLKEVDPRPANTFTVGATPPTVWDAAMARCTVAQGALSVHCAESEPVGQQITHTG